MFYDLCSFYTAVVSLYTFLQTNFQWKLKLKLIYPMISENLLIINRRIQSNLYMIVKLVVKFHYPFATKHKLFCAQFCHFKNGGDSTRNTVFVWESVLKLFGDKNCTVSEILLLYCWLREPSGQDEAYLARSGLPTIFPQICYCCRRLSHWNFTPRKIFSFFNLPIN